MQLYSFRSHFSSALSLALYLSLSVCLSVFLSLSLSLSSFFPLHAITRLVFFSFASSSHRDCINHLPPCYSAGFFARYSLSRSFFPPRLRQNDSIVFFILCIFILRCFIFLSGVARSFLVQEEKKVHWNRGHHEIPALSRSAPPTIELSGFSSRRDQRKGDEIRSPSRNTGDASFSFFVRAGCIVSAPDVATSRCRRDHDQSFDETSMDSCPLAAIIEARPGDLSKDGNEMEVTSLEEAKSVIAALRARQRAQAHQMLAWRRTLKLQEDLVARLTREKAEQLRTLSSQLLLFESRLCRKQKEIEASLAQRESIILRQQRVIRQLQSRLAERSTGTRDSPPCDALDRLDSLGDSDSAVVLEEAADDLAPPRFRSNITDVTVIRSVSDAVEPSSKYSSMRRCNGFLRRPEILETVYSVEEDGDSENNQDPSESTENSECEERRAKNLGNGKGRLQDLYGSFERLAQEADSPPNERPRDESQQAQVTYNRVMSNHRSVTKPKDVKYKRINKAKSKSLEELRGRLRNWVEKGNKIAISLDQSYA